MYFVLLLNMYFYMIICSGRCCDIDADTPIVLHMFYIIPAIDQPRSLNLPGGQALVHSLIEDNPETIDHPKQSSDMSVVHSSTRDNTNQPAFKGIYS